MNVTNLFMSVVIDVILSKSWLLETSFLSFEFLYKGMGELYKMDNELKDLLKKITMWSLL